jgi:hypothetical protein
VDRRRAADPADRPVRANPACRRGEQLGDVNCHLTAGRGERGEAEVGQPGVSVLADKDVGIMQRPVRDPRLVQAAHLEPHVTSKLVGDAVGRDLV